MVRRQNIERAKPRKRVCREQRICVTPGCDVLFTPAHPDQMHHSIVCARRAQRRHRARGQSDSKGSPTFWYSVLDTIHFFRLSLPEIYVGKATIHRKDWVRLFYRAVDDDPNALRAWERFKQKSRKYGLIEESDDPTHVAEIEAGFVHIDVSRAYDGAFDVLGAPHPGGQDAEARAFERLEQKKRQELLARLAGALEERKRAVK